MVQVVPIDRTNVVKAHLFEQRAACKQAACKLVGAPCSKAHRTRESALAWPMRRSVRASVRLVHGSPNHQKRSRRLAPRVVVSEDKGTLECSVCKYGAV